MATPTKLTLIITFDDGSINQGTIPLDGPYDVRALSVGINEDWIARAEIVDNTAPGARREYSQDQPVTATDDRDPGNTDPEEMTEPLDPDDDVYTLINQNNPK
jgi:hypothetical protein